MSLMNHRTLLATGLIAAVCLAAGPRPVAAPIPGGFERLVARALNPSDHGAAPAPIEIVIERWSTDDESERLHDTLIHNGPDQLIAILQHTPRRAGVMQVPGIQALGARARTRRSHIVQFARNITTPSSRQVVVALGGPTALGEHMGLAELRADKRPPGSVFTLIDIRFAPDGTGIGKVGIAGKVAYNTNTRTIELANYEKEPLRLTAVKSEYFSGGWARRTGR